MFWTKGGETNQRCNLFDSILSPFIPTKGLHTTFSLIQKLCYTNLEDASVSFPLLHSLRPLQGLGVDTDGLGIASTHFIHPVHPSPYIMAIGLDGCMDRFEILVVPSNLPSPSQSTGLGVEVDGVGTTPFHTPNPIHNPQTFDEEEMGVVDGFT